MKKLVPLLVVFLPVTLLSSCTIYQSSGPAYDTIAVGYYENGSYIDNGYYAGYGYNEPNRWYGVSYPDGYNNSIWYAH